VFTMDLKIFKKEWCRLIDKEEYKYFVTLTFTRYVPEDVQRKSIEELLHFLNGKMFGRKYKKHNEYLQGYIFKENKYLKHKNSNPLRNPTKNVLSRHDHYHILIQDNNIFYDNTKPTLETHLFQQIHKIREPHYLNGVCREMISQVIRNRNKHYHKSYDMLLYYLCYYYIDAQKLFSPVGLDIQDVYDENISQYCTKEVYWTNGCNIGTLEIDGIILT
jgi:hypothetical protein